MEFLRIFLAGLTLGAPFGPIGILCMEKTVVDGRKIGFSAALGAITVDVLYTAISFLFLIQVKSYILEHEVFFQIFVGVFLVIIGLMKLIKKAEVSDNLIEKSTENAKSVCIKFILLSLPNVFNILSIIAIFTAWRIFDVQGEFAVLKVVPIVFLGNLSLWFITTTILSIWREKITPKWIQNIVKICGLAILFFGLSLLFKALPNFF